MQLQNKLRQYNHQWQLRLLKMAENSRSDCSSGSQRLPQSRFGIGIHGGEVVAGVIGAGGLSKCSATGDPINVASRVEGLTSNFQVDLLITEEIRRRLEERFVLRAMPPTQVKGKAEPLQASYVEPSAQPPRPSIAGTRRPSA